MKYVNILSAGLLLLATACEKDIPKFSDPECLLNFYYGQSATTETVTDDLRWGSYSFRLNATEDQTVDTVWLEVTTMGMLSSENRPVQLEQVMLGGDTINAEAGVHYVPFDDPEIMALSYVPANATQARLPIVVKRDPSLATDGDVVLKVTFKDNGYFQSGYKAFSTYTLTISDRLSKPTMWAAASLDYYLGVYGQKKHELMIEWSGEAWDDTYIESLFTVLDFGYAVVYIAKDESYLNYLSAWFAERLAEEEAVSGPIYEEDGVTKVDFTPLAW